MKALFFVLMMLPAIASTYANNGRSIITIICSNGKPFAASINNGEITYSTKQINFTHLKAGEHFLIVYRSLSTQSGIEQKSQTIFKGSINVIDDIHYIYTINHKSILVLTESLPLGYPSSKATPIHGMALTSWPILTSGNRIIDARKALENQKDSSVPAYISTLPLLSQRIKRKTLMQT